MRTTKTSRTFPSRKMLFLFIVSASVFCLLSIMVPHARVSDSTVTNETKELFTRINEVEPETKIEVQNWMLDFQTKD